MTSKEKNKNLLNSIESRLESVDVVTFIVGVIGLFGSVLYSIDETVDENGATDRNFNGSEVIDGIIVSVFLMILVDKMFQWIKTRNRDDHTRQMIVESEESISQRISDLGRRFDGAVDCVYIGGRYAALEHLKLRLKTAKACYNTMTTFGLREKQDRSFLYTTATLKEMAHHYVNMLTSEDTYLCSIINGRVEPSDAQCVVDERLSCPVKWFNQNTGLAISTENSGEMIYRIECEMKRRRQEYRSQFQSDDTARQRLVPEGTHECYVLDERKMLQSGEMFPVLNFTIIEYSDNRKDKEVMFGWGHHNLDWHGATFVSSNPEVVATFMHYFENLKSLAGFAPLESGFPPDDDCQMGCNGVSGGTQTDP